MKSQFSASLTVLAVLYLFACKSKDSNTPAAAVAADTLRYEMRTFVKHYCVNDRQCADFNIIYPDIAGDSAQTKIIKDAIRARIVEGVGGNGKLPFEIALDSAAVNFINDFIQFKREVPAMEADQNIQMTGNVTLNNPKIATVRLDFNSFRGGAHPNSAVAVMTFDRASGRELKITDFIRDTTAVLSLLEKAYKEAKGLKATDDISQLLLLNATKLALPANAGILKEGILFAYGDYEVSPHAVGPADIVLSWEQLGALADKKRWLE